MVVFGTGYNVKTPFIDDAYVPDNYQGSGLYKYVFPIHLRHPSLACIGLFPTDSGFTPVGEQQSRWAVRVFKGLITLPSVKKMEEDSQEKETTLCKRYGRPKLLVPGIPLTDELTKDIGCYPSLKRLFLTDPRLALAVFWAPVTPFTYRLRGPHAWSGARDAVLGCWDACSSGVGKGKMAQPPFSSSWWMYWIMAIIVVLGSVYLSICYN